MRMTRGGGGDMGLEHALDDFSSRLFIPLLTFETWKKPQDNPNLRKKKFSYTFQNLGGKCLKNSIAFCSAPRREADSQPISQLVRQAVS